MSKLEAYKAGHYRFKAPPVYSGNWDDAAWVAYIDAYKGWTVPVEGDTDE